MNPEQRRRRLDGLAQEQNPARRRLLALGIVADRLREIGVEPILVGGAALEFYTAGGYSTGDVDLAMPKGPDVDAAFADLGFEKEGRFWIREDLELYFEAPAPAGLPGETAPRTEIEIEGLKIVVLGLEDLLVDRVRAWVHWRSEEDRRWARHLAVLYADRLDRRYLYQRAADIPEEAAALEQLFREVEEIRSRGGS